MTQTLRTIVDSIHQLTIGEQLQLFELLEEELAQHEEDAFENDPKVTAEIHEARLQYERGDFVTVDEYLSTRTKRHD